MKKCRNPECGKEIPDSLTYCNESCVRRYYEIKKENKNTLPIYDNNEERKAVNTGTNNKFQLQDLALKFLKKYPKDKTAKQYSSLLCWDIGVTQRTAFESYIEPMIEHGILIPSGSNCYRFNPKYG